MWLVTWAARSRMCRITEVAPPLWINLHPNPWVLSLRWYVNLFLQTSIWETITVRIGLKHAFHLLKTKLMAERPTNKQQLKLVAVKAWQSITKEKTQSLVMSMSSRLKAVIACKRFSTKYKKLTFYLWLYLFVQLHLSHWKWGDCA